MTDSPELRFVGAAASHTGLVRRHNEDSGFAGPALLLVADGVGGHAHGEVASSIAAHVVSATALRTAGAHPVTALRESVALAQERVADVARRQGHAGMATTLTAVLGDGRRFALVQLGDSRAYRLRDGALVRLSTDHTVVQQMLDDGALDASQARHHPWSHVVTRVLGGDPRQVGDLVDLDLRAGDRLLLCSDGLSDLVEDAEMSLLLDEHDDAGAVDALVAAALRAGGRDNVTAIVATLERGRPDVGAGRLVGAAAVHETPTSRTA